MEFINSDVNKKRGVVLYIKEKWEPKLICKEEEGRVIVVQINYLYKQSGIL